MLKSDYKLRAKVLNRLESSDDGQEHSRILNIFSKYSKIYINPEAILELMTQGRWDVQISCIPFILSHIRNNDESNVKRKEFLNMIYELIQNPIDRFQSPEPEKT